MIYFDDNRRNFVDFAIFIKDISLKGNKKMNYFQKT